MIAQCVPSSLNLKVVVFDDKDYDFAKMIHHRYPDIPFYLQVGNPYLSDSVDNHTEKLLERYEQLVDLVMQSNDMNHVYVLPQLHTLLWSNKRCIRITYFTFYKSYLMNNNILIDIIVD